MRRRFSDHSDAPAGRMTSGRKIPQVSGIASGLADWSTLTGRAIFSEVESSATQKSHSFRSSGLACRDARASRARPTVSLSARTKKPTNQTKRTMPASLPNSGEAAPAITIIAGKFSEPTAVPIVFAGVPECSGTPENGGMPCGQQQHECGKGERTENPGRPRMVPEGSGLTAQSRHDEPRQDKKNCYLFRAGNEKCERKFGAA